MPPEAEPLVSYDLLWRLTFAPLVVAPLGYVVATAVRDWWRDRGWWSPARRALEVLGRRHG